MNVSNKKNIDLMIKNPYWLTNAFQPTYECRPHILQFNKYSYQQETNILCELKELLNQSLNEYESSDANTIASSNNWSDNTLMCTNNNLLVLDDVMESNDLESVSTKFMDSSALSSKKTEHNVVKCKTNPCIFVNHDTERDPFLLSCSLQSLPDVDHLIEREEPSSEVQLLKTVTQRSIKNPEDIIGPKLNIPQENNNKETSSYEDNISISLNTLKVDCKENKLFPVIQTKRYDINNYMFFSSLNKIANDRKNANKVVINSCDKQHVNNKKQDKEIQVNEWLSCENSSSDICINETHVDYGIKLDNMNSKPLKSDYLENIDRKIYNLKSDIGIQTYCIGDNVNEQNIWDDKMCVPKIKLNQKSKEKKLSSNLLGRSTEKMVSEQQSYWFQTINNTFTKFCEVVKKGTELCQICRDEDCASSLNTSKTTQCTTKRDDNESKLIRRTNMKESGLPWLVQSEKKTSNSATASNALKVSIEFNKENNRKEISKIISKQFNEGAVPIQKLEIYEGIGQNDFCFGDIELQTFYEKEMSKEENISMKNLNLNLQTISAYKFNENGIKHKHYKRQEKHMETETCNSNLTSKTSVVSAESSKKELQYNKMNNVVKAEKENTSKEHQNVFGLECEEIGDRVLYNCKSKFNEKQNTEKNDKFKNKMKDKSVSADNYGTIKTLVKPVVFNPMLPAFIVPELEMNVKKDNENEYGTVEFSKSSEETVQQSNLLLLDSGDPAILFNRCGFPLTDFKGRKLKNNLGTELLSVNSVKELIKSQLLVFDCFNISVKEVDFNPIKGINLQNKDEIQIIDDKNQPVRLYNNFGYPLNDEDGLLLYDSQGNLLVILDSRGGPICCNNSEPIFIQDGTLWVVVRDKYNIIHYGKQKVLENSEHHLHATRNQPLRNRSVLSNVIKSKQFARIKTTNKPKQFRSLSTIYNSDKMSGNIFRHTEVNPTRSMKEVNDKAYSSLWGKYHKVNNNAFSILTKNSPKSNLYERRLVQVAKLTDNPVFCVNTKQYKPIMPPHIDRPLYHADQIYKKALALSDYCDNYLINHERRKAKQEFTTQTEQYVKTYKDIDYVYNTNNYDSLYTEPICQRIINNNFNAWSLNKQKSISLNKDNEFIGKNINYIGKTFMQSSFTPRVSNKFARNNQFNLDTFLLENIYNTKKELYFN